MQIAIDMMTCQYGVHPVLKVNNLVFEGGQMYFVLGKSGAGKSTFLEALGLMTDSMTPDSKVFYTIDKHTTDIRDLWQSGDEVLSKFRQDNYSFIFQNTNLMDNFTVGENMCFTLMMNGVSMEDSKQTVLRIMKQLELEEELFNKKTVNISGGQRQRVAFVRAFTAPHHVLFCDEPTGNLDEVIAHKLMSELKKEIKQKNKIAIIVSHDINLALHFADKIIDTEVMHQSEKCGIMDQSHQFHKDGTTGNWCDHTNHQIQDFRSLLVEKISI